MKIRHYLYNAFLVEDDTVKVAIDPGQNLWLFKLRSLIPESEWETITHVLITHGDPDHHWQSDRVAKASGAFVVCGKGMTKVEDGQTLVIDPRGRELRSWICFDNLHPMDVGETISLGAVSIEAIKSVHGPIVVPFLGFRVKKEPGPNERVGLGAMGFRIRIGDRTVVNLGDSVLLSEWESLEPDVLMLPIGGAGNNTWTMDVQDALAAVRSISPRVVIPCHYNASLLWTKNVNPADDQHFKREVEKLGVECRLMDYGDEITI